ncbi:hypothetical protein [Nocardia sp. NPDC052566]|uniref:hypothetical protein n=1 Tax=Nocardia sp. NPDC052566 TaxID=3364330 RepID=UPI0037C92E29
MFNWVHGTVTAALPTSDSGTIDNAAATIAAHLSELFGTNASAVIDKADNETGTADFTITANGCVPADYRIRLAAMASYLSGVITVLEHHAHAVKHVLADGKLIDHDGRIIFADEKTATEEQISSALNTAVDDIQDIADLPETGAIDALNLTTNTALHRLFEDPGATLAEVVDYCYGDQAYDDPERTGLDTVIDWINS